ncbi:P-type ATPase [Clostridium sp. JNZ J1-5]
MKAWYNHSWSDVVKELNSDIKYGLTEKGVEESRNSFGDNRSLNLKNKSFSILFLKQLIKSYSIIGIIICVLLFYLKEIKLPIIILGIIIFCSAFYALKEYNNHNKLNYITKITPKKALVLREKKIFNVNPEELVVGDIIYLEKGDIVPADIRIIECENLKVRESAITSDNQIVEKYETKIEDREISLSEMKNMVFKSSFIMDGTGTGIVVQVGDNTEIGSITKDLLENNLSRSVIEENVSKIVKYPAMVFFIVAALICAYGFYYKLDMKNIIRILTLGYLTMVPMEIVLSVGLISFAIKRKKKKDGIELEGLSSMQLLAGTSVMLFDKVGTLTEEHMYIDSFFSNGKIIKLNSSDLEENKDNIDRILNIGLLCNDGKVDNDGNIVKGSLIEKAIIRYGKGNLLNKKTLDVEQERIFQIPFDLDKRVKTTLNKIDDKYRANVVGAVDKLLERCTHIMKNGIEVEITPKDIVEIRDADLSLSLNALNVIGLAYRNFNYQPSPNENIESNLVFVGLIGLENPTKEDSIEDVMYCKSLAIKPIVMTDDNRITANAFGEKIKILNKNDLVLSGVEIDNMNEDELEKFVEKVGVYSKISPKIKFRIVEGFKKLGYDLTITGNRFTDLPSFRAAHVGIATGKECTKIAKKLSDVYIQDNNLFKILSLIEESRKVIQCIKNIIIFNLISVLIQVFSIFIINNIIDNTLTVNLISIGLINFFTLTLSSILIYTQHNNIENNRYENIKINKKIFKDYTSGLIMYVIFLVASVGITFYLGNVKSDILGKINMFTILNLNTTIFAFYFMEFKDVIRNKMSILVIAINLIIYGVTLKVLYISNTILLKNIFWELKILLIALILQIIFLRFIKEVDKK